MKTISKITDIGQIPSDWNIKTIEQLFENGFQNGVFFEVDRKGKGIPIVNVSDLYGSVPIDGRKLEKFNATEKEIERFIVHKGDLFFTRSSVVPAGIAMCNVYDDKDENGAVFDSHVIKLSVNQQEVNSLFLCLQCRMPYCRSFFIANSKTAIMTTIDQKSLAKCPIPMPQLSEQDDIVGTIRRFDTYIDDLAELIEKKRGIRDGALEDMMSGRIRLQGFTADWVVYPFSKYFSLLPTNTCSRDQLSDRGQVGDIHYGDVLIKYGDVLSNADEIPRLKDVLRIKERSFLKMHDV